MDPLKAAALATAFTWGVTALGAASVLLFRQVSPKLLNLFLGFGAGVMLAASIWSLLLPAIDSSGWLLPALGLCCGAAFLLLTDWWMDSRPWEKAPASRWSLLLILAVTLHNIPEGMAVGLAFARAAQNDGGFLWLSAAGALALGIGIQNFPEGAAIALPLRQEGNSRARAFGEGCLSGSVEPIFGVLAAIVAGSVAPLMPWFLSFAAGAMMVVVVEELIPEARLDQSAHAGTLSVMFGFLLMMVLDVALG